MSALRRDAAGRGRIEDSRDVGEIRMIGSNDRYFVPIGFCEPQHRPEAAIDLRLELRAIRIDLVDPRSGAIHDEEQMPLPFDPSF
jgi:hypothetical protein